jgi:hypothetical protein
MTAEKKGIKKPINYTIKNIDRLGKAIRTTKLNEETLAVHLKSAFKTSEEAGLNFTKALIRTTKNKKQFVKEGASLFTYSLKMPVTHQKKIIAGFVEEAGKAGSIFLVQNISGLKKKEARKYMATYIEVGGNKNDVAEWLQLAGKVLRKHHIKNSDTAGAVVDAIGDAVDWVVDTIEDGVDAILEGIDTIIDAITTAGAAIVDLFEEVVSWTAEQMGNLLRALIEAGRQIGEFIAATFDWAYAAVSSFVQAAFELGFTIADILANVVSQTYFVFRRFINGILVNLGPIGGVLDFVLDQFETGVASLWRSTLLAVRFAEGELLDALDWMATQTQEVMNEMIAAWESIGEDLITLYEWGLAAGNAVWDAIGEATATIGNSIYYAYNFLRTSGVQFIFDFTRGLIRAGQAIATVIGWAVDQSIEICGEVVRGIIAVGGTIGQMLINVMNNPGNALNIFLNAINTIGSTLEDLMQAVIIDTAQEFQEQVVQALVEIGQATVDILLATLRVSAAALADIVAVLFNLLGSYRSLTTAERNDARLVFGNSLDYDLISVATEDPLNEVVFGLQDFFSGNPDSRAFVTGNLINFDVSDGIIDRATLIHELTHVWQHREVGGIYMAEAILAQVNGAGYNYGYFDDTNQFIGTGNGARTTFNRTMGLSITPGSCQIIEGGMEVARDDASGNIFTDDGTINGTINYTTGALSITFNTAPASGSTIALQRVVTITTGRSGQTELVFEGDMLGTGGEAALNAAGGDITQFNPEQQGQIMMHWFIRNRLRVTGNDDRVLRLSTTAWDPYRNFVRAS